MTTAKVMPGAEPFAFQGDETGVLLVHGYTGSPQGLREWGEHLAAAGRTVSGPRLPGHGTRPEDLHGVGFADFVAEADRALRGLLERCSNVFVGALSMGSTVALELAHRYGDDVAGLMLVNPFLFSKDPRVKLAPVIGKLNLLLKGVYNDIADPSRTELGYPKVSSKCSLSVLRAGEAVRAKLPQIRNPVLIFSSRRDHVVDPANAQEVFRRIGSADKEIIHLERSYHVATLDYDRDIIFERSADFIAKHAKD